MPKIFPQYAHGIEFIQLNQLPFDQAQKLSDYLTEASFLKIKFSDFIMDNCIPYEEYEYWYDHWYSDAEVMEDYDF